MVRHVISSLIVLGVAHSCSRRDRGPRETCDTRYQHRSESWAKKDSWWRHDHHAEERLLLACV